jgi:hypothetical protein
MASVALVLANRVPDAGALHAQHPLQAGKELLLAENRSVDPAVSGCLLPKPQQ